MLEHGCSRLPADENGRILDRLAGLEKYISPALITQVLTATNKQSTRVCLLTNEIMLWVVLAMGLFTDKPIRQVFKACRKLHLLEKSPARSSLCMARQRLGSAPVKELYQQVVKPMATKNSPGAFFHDMRLVGIDGTILDVFDCDAFQHF